jgi:hypothetical protein
MWHNSGNRQKEDIMKLIDLRKTWEPQLKGNAAYSAVLEVARTDGDYATVFVVLAHGQPYGDRTYRLMRYFPAGGGAWQVSVDVDWNDSIDPCLDEISMAFAESIPK